MDSALTLIVLMCCVVCQEDPYLVSSVELSDGCLQHSDDPP
jgi:hypothetical protein